MAQKLNHGDLAFLLDFEIKIGNRKKNYLNNLKCKVQVLVFG
jgi:hypothetical protein